MAIQIEVTYRPGQPPETVQHTVPDPLPAELSKTAFMDHAIAQFIAVNGGDIGDGYERFDEVMEAARTSAQGKVRAAYKRYDAADTFSKDTTAILTEWMVGSLDAGKLTDAERTAVLNNWPAS